MKNLRYYLNLVMLVVYLGFTGFMVKHYGAVIAVPLVIAPLMTGFLMMYCIDEEMS